jgi:hypothetical protein
MLVLFVIGSCKQGCKMTTKWKNESNKFHEKINSMVKTASTGADTRAQLFHEFVA